MTEQVIFPEGNTVCYGQDFCYHHGVPAGVLFNVCRLPDGRRVKLTAYGYGLLTGDCVSYGNGALYVATDDLPGTEGGVDVE
jgi:hypothetical protein